MFPGGLKALSKFVKENLRYPDEAKENQVSGVVFVSFIVAADGTITDVTVAKGIGSGCDEEAVRVVKSMPKWKPGRQSGKNLPVRMSLPIRFTPEQAK